MIAHVTPKYLVDAALKHISEYENLVSGIKLREYRFSLFFEWRLVYVSIDVNDAKLPANKLERVA